MREQSRNPRKVKQSGAVTDERREQNVVRTYEFHGKEPRQVQEFLAKVYAENEFKSTGKNGRFRTDIRTNACADIGLCNVSHAAPFTFESTTPRDSFLVFSCIGGTGNLRAEDLTVHVHSSRSVPLSATGFAGISGESALTHFSIHIGTERIHSLCAQWVGCPLAHPLVFDLTPFAQDLADRWQRVIKATDALMNLESPPPIAIVSLREHAIDMLLESHPHNYSRFLRGHMTASAQLVRDAMRFMDDNADLPIAISDVAGALRCSVQSLHQGFREHERTTPRAFLYSARMKRVRDSLTSDSAVNTAADAANQYGFVNYECFGAAYVERYGERPETTFFRHDGAYSRLEKYESTARGPILTDKKAEMLRKYIDTHTGSRILVRSLAQQAGMSVQNFILAFTKAFGTTPAQYVISERLRRACWLLENTDDSISSIAAETGFASQSHLTTTLKQHEGLTPIQYRKSSAK
jgi:AraC family transcriptional regulator